MVTLFNYGSNTENYNVTAYVNSTVIESSKTGILTSRNCTFISFTLNTTEITLGTVLELSATVGSVLGEVDSGDNVLVFGWVLVTLAGDVDGDAEVSIFDIVSIAGAYGSSVGDSEYDIDCDLDGDGDVDIFDILIAAGNYGEQY